MVLVFILFIIIILITIFVFTLALSTIKFKVENMDINNTSDKTKVNSSNFKLKIDLYLFNKIKYFSYKLNKQKLEKMYKRMKSSKIDFNTLKEKFKVEQFKLEDLKCLKILNLKIDKLNLFIKVGTEDFILTTFIVFFISTIISIILPHTVKKYDNNRYYYQILPFYINKNVYEIKLDCIIEVKMVHIINIIYVFYKKRRVDNNEQRASNRRSYGYIYE